MKKLFRTLDRWIAEDRETYARIGAWFMADRGVGRWVQLRVEAVKEIVFRIRNSRLAAQVSRFLLTADSWLDSSLFGSGQSARDVYERFSMFMDRFYVSGAKRFTVEMLCEGMTISIAGGLLLLALAMPAFDLTSEDWLKKQDLAVTFLDRYGDEIGRRGIRHDDTVPFDELPPNLVHAVIATEDRRFFDHFGIDIIGTLRALTVNTRANGVVQGGSSLTQQLAKNLFLSNERTIQRKVNEAFLALWLEFHLTKREILSLYLDRAYLGGGTFGVQAASEFYFGKSVRDLTLPEAAMIGGLFKAPTKYAPHINLPAARARANDVLNNMVEAGYLTPGQIYAAQRNPATPVDRQNKTSPEWYMDYAYDEVKALAEAGRFGAERVITARLAIDPAMQQHAEDTIENELRQFGTGFHASQGATVLMEPNGAVRAIVGGRDYGASQFNRATDALRQPGSSFKPYVYLTALMTGRYKPSTMISGASLCLGNWCPHNYKNESAGRLPLVTALAMSLNTVAVRLSIDIGEGHAPNNSSWLKAKAGRAMIVATARKMGISTPLPDTVSLPLGADAVKLIEQTSAYATFSNGGKRAPAYAVISATNGRGDVIYDHDRDRPKPQQIIPLEDIEMMNQMLHQVVLGGTGRRANLDGFQVSGKTGTTNNYHDAWFVGFTGNFVCGTWYGNDDYSQMKEMTGGTLPAATFHEIMAFAHQNVEPKPVPGLPPPAPANHVAAKDNLAVTDVMAPRPQPPANLSKASVAVLGTIASSMHVAELGRGGGPQEIGPASKPAEMKRSDRSTSQIVNLQ